MIHITYKAHATDLQTFCNVLIMLKFTLWIVNYESPIYYFINASRLQQVLNFVLNRSPCSALGWSPFCRPNKDLYVIVSYNWLHLMSLNK